MHDSVSVAVVSLCFILNPGSANYYFFADRSHMMTKMFNIRINNGIRIPMRQKYDFCA